MQNKIDEIVGLVRGYAEGIRQGLISEAQGDGFNQGCSEFAQKKLDLIRSKLRDLVREPLSDEDIEMAHLSLGVSCPLYVTQRIIRWTERTHGIANTSGEV